MLLNFLNYRIEVSKIDSEDDLAATDNINEIIQSSMTSAASSNRHPLELIRKYKFKPIFSNLIRSPFLKSIKLYCLYTFPSYVTVVSTTTSFSAYTFTKTFTITNCIPQPFSYSVCPA